MELSTRIYFFTGVHYLLLFMGFFLAFKILKKTRGNSILAIFTISLFIQGGFGLIYYLIAYEDPSVYLTEDSIFRLVSSMCLVSLILIIYLWFVKRNLKIPGGMPAENIAISNLFLGILVLISIGYLIILLRSPASIHVINYGAEVLGGEDYYKLRAELIQIRTDTHGGSLQNRFIRLTYGLILMSGIVFLYLFSIRKNLLNLILGYIMITPLFIQAILSFQKTPMVTMFAVAIAPIFIFSYHHKSKRVVFQTRRVLVLGSCIGFLGVMTFIMFQGFQFSDAIGATMRRIFLVPIHTSALHCHVYPDYRGFVKFSDIGTLRQIVTLGDIPIYGSMAREVAITLKGGDFNANTNIIGSGWGTWGYFGVFLVTIIMASLFTIIDFVTNKNRLILPVFPLVIYYWFFFLTYGNGSFQNVLSATSLWIIPFLYVYLYKLPRPVPYGNLHYRQPIKST